MKNLKLYVMACICWSSFTAAFSQHGDSLVAGRGNWNLYGNADGTLRITDKEGRPLFTGLKFAKPVGDGLQVIDAHNRLFFLNDRLEQTDSLHHFIGVCGTVPHYELSVRETKDDFIIMEDETFYDYGNKIPAEAVAKISKSRADRVFFINRETRYLFTSNYGYVRYAAPSPRTVFYEKNGKYAALGDTDNALYDELWLDNGLVKVKKDGLQGYYGITGVRYQNLEAFGYYLARFELPDGTRGYVDAEGREYPD